MAKVFFAMAAMTMMFNLLVSFVIYSENQRSRMYAEAEVRRAGAVFIMSIEEYKENIEFMKIGDTRGLTADTGILFGEFDHFLRNCRYVRNDDIKLKILILDEVIWYFDSDNEELYAEARAVEEEAGELACKIRRQMLRVFDPGEFEIDPGLFRTDLKKALILIYENRYRNIGFTDEIKNRYYYVRIVLDK